MNGTRQTGTTETSKAGEALQLIEVPGPQKQLCSALALVQQNEITAVVLSGAEHWESWERSGDHTWHHWRDGSLLKDKLAGQFLFTGCGCLTFEGKSKVMPLVSWCLASFLALVRIVRLPRPAAKSTSEKLVPIKSIHFYSVLCTNGWS